ncbi:hypothetical protein [Nocardia sp. NPDC052112]|uniref:hypothetical protein n=1 Tax=Nocardia sp. NPDC052112 TaxID=3155646 RepID=UPI00342CF3F0
MADAVKQRMLDRLLRVAAERAAAPSGIRFTERQLYYEVCRMLAPTHRASRRFAFTIPAPLSYPAFRAALDGREVPGLLTPAPPRSTRAGLHTPEPDLFDYGLPRLLVCESDAVAQMLRANGLPMESACPILSASELPLDPGIARMLSRVDGTIYLLHDASPHGLSFPTRLAHLTDIPDRARIVPLGLRPRQAGGLHLPHLRGPVPSAEGAQVDPWERAGLRGRESNAHAVQMESGESDEFRGDLSASALVAQLDPGELAGMGVPGSSAHAAQMEWREREDLLDGLSASVPVAQVDLGELAESRAPESTTRAAEVASGEREDSRNDLAVSDLAAQVRRGEHAATGSSPVPHAPAAQLDPWERAWLRRDRFVEVEAVRPASLLRTVHRLVREVRPPRSGWPELRRARTTGFLTWPAA